MEERLGRYTVTEILRSKLTQNSEISVKKSRRSCVEVRNLRILEFLNLRI